MLDHASCFMYVCVWVCMHTSAAHTAGVQLMFLRSSQWEKERKNKWEWHTHFFETHWTLYISSKIFVGDCLVLYLARSLARLVSHFPFCFFFWDVIFFFKLVVFNFYFLWIKVWLRVLPKRTWFVQNEWCWMCRWWAMLVHSPKTITQIHTYSHIYKCTQ